MFIFGNSSLCRTRQPAWSPAVIATTTSRRFLLACTGFQYASESCTRRRCLCGSACTMQPLAIWLTCVCRPTMCMVASNYMFHGVWDFAGPACRTATGQRSFAINGPRTCIEPADLRTPDTTLCSFKRHLKAHLFQQCCWNGSAPFVWRRCDCLASSAPFTNIQIYASLSLRKTYLLTYLHFKYTRTVSTVTSRKVHGVESEPGAPAWVCSVVFQQTILSLLSNQQ